MNLNKFITKLEEEINGKKRSEVIEVIEEELIDNIEELSENENFFNLSLDSIFSIISKVEFNENEENALEIIKNITKNVVKMHSKEKETILILQNINTTTISLSYDEIFSILELITNCPILSNLCNMHKEEGHLVDIDYLYEIDQKNKEIEKLKQEIINLSSNKTVEKKAVTERPADYEPDIFKACSKGKLETVQWLIEKEFVDKNECSNTTIYSLNIYENDKPIHVACSNGHLPIVKYLIVNQYVNINIKGYLGKTPLHCACEKGHQHIVEYLISNDANIEALDINSKTPLHYACIESHLPIVEYLISKGANLEARDKAFWTPLHWASCYVLTDVVNYLVSKGANTNAKNSFGKIPSILYSTGILTDKYGI